MKRASRKPWNSLFLVFIALLGAVALTGCNNDDPNTLTDEPEDFDDLKPFSSTATYSNVLTDCVKAESESEYCTLGTLPLLGQEVDNPTVNDIMNRLVISHDWMADNFEEILYLLPEEMLPLFKGLTAIVIDDDIRPAFYTTSTGAIYLDPAYLWVTVQDKDTINRKEDYRSEFDDLLIFGAWSAYVSGNRYAINSGSLTDPYPREVTDAMYSLARLLLHELAHVNDFIPPDSYDTLTSNMKVNNASSNLVNQRPSNNLDDDGFLASQMHNDLARVMYFGDTPSLTQRQITAAEAGEEFEPDGASDHYAYSNQFEDAAMLFENALMKMFFDFDYYVGFVDIPTNGENCEDYPLQWGEFNRVGDANVRARAQYIIAEILPNLDTTEFFQNLEVPSPAVPGISWCQNLDNRGSNTSFNSIEKQKAPTQIPWDQLQHGYL